ncbi:hypothetical protein EYF80_053264 [Liparis tanakae]|uniref:Uncharacterized protein n=1 Tax=Liparis tanakae TaxID=230148 RepID=A0A4Z2F6S7_9TELE|nr:hypothetical protein EYF80_053264 [Liparis tanakae]
MDSSFTASRLGGRRALGDDGNPSIVKDHVVLHVKRRPLTSQEFSRDKVSRPKPRIRNVSLCGSDTGCCFYYLSNIAFLGAVLSAAPPQSVL